LIIDFHVHPPRPFEPRERCLQTWQRMLDAGRRAGIDVQVLYGWAEPVSNEVVRDLVARDPDRVIGFVRAWCSDPASPATVERYVVEHGFKGIKIHDERDWPLRGLLGGHPIFTVAGRLGVPILVHSCHEEEGLSADTHDELGVGHYPVRIMAELGKRYPDTTFVFAHAGMMWVKAVQAIQPYPNLYVDVSGFDPERGIVEKAVEVLGAERVLFGSDAPGRSYAAQVAKVKYAEISEADRALILGGNAARLLGLGGQS
jgi:predicted TIM-barrel fold metal-dependent hydrolase